MKYFMQHVETTGPVEVDLKKFIECVQGEMLFGDTYYEHFWTLIGHGQKITGTQHIFWMEWGE